MGQEVAPHTNALDDTGLLSLFRIDDEVEKALTLGGGDEAKGVGEHPKQEFPRHLDSIISELNTGHCHPYPGGTVRITEGALLKVV